MVFLGSQYLDCLGVIKNTVALYHGEGGTGPNVLQPPSQVNGGGWIMGQKQRPALAMPKRDNEK